MLVKLLIIMIQHASVSVSEGRKNLQRIPMYSTCMYVTVCMSNHTTHAHTEAHKVRYCAQKTLCHVREPSCALRESHITSCS